VLASAVEALGLRGPVLVGLSGGADSVALLCGLLSLPGSADCHPIAAHVNHGLRPQAAEEDARWCDALCRQLGVPFMTTTFDVGAFAQSERLTLEEAARTLRYRFFEQAARDRCCPAVAVAHTADDRVETVLHHLLRGTGLAGLRGMKGERPLGPGVRLVRPLLKVGRRQVEAWLAEIGQEYRTDETNSSLDHTRNRIRHVLLPGLERDFGPGIRERLLSLADQADECQSAIEELAGRLLDNCLVDDATDVCRLDCRPLDEQPRHLVREMFVVLWKRRNWPRRGMGFDDWDRLYRLATGGGSATLPGRIQATRRESLLVLERDWTRV
jgi:tRNA(Ile)-lysidine synthase